MLCRARAAPLRPRDNERIERNSLESHQVAWGGHRGRLGHGDGSGQRIRRRDYRCRLHAGCSLDGQLDQRLRNQRRHSRQIRLCRLRRGDLPDHRQDRRFRRLRRPADSGTGRRLQRLRPDPLGPLRGRDRLQPPRRQEGGPETLGQAFAGHLLRQDHRTRERRCRTC